MLIFGIVLFVLAGAGLFIVNKVLVYKEAPLKMWHNVLLIAAIVGAISAIVAAIAK